MAHRFWQPAQANDVALSAQLAAGMESVWLNEHERSEVVSPMRAVNPEWDFMARTFLLMGEANLALSQPERKGQCLSVIDRVMADTLASERTFGPGTFLMPYHRAKPWIQQPPRSVFVDGEIALVLGARRLVEEHAESRDEFQRRVRLIVQRMERAPLFHTESYPDECWVFCNAIAMAALRMSEVLDGEDHGELRRKWLDAARSRLIDQETGLLIAAYSLDGTPHPAGPGPEGSSIWLAAHMLQVVDPAFAADQYRRARKHLGRSLFGFGFSREWPPSQSSFMNLDIDSGLTVPVLGASPSASGLALLAASAFEDEDFERSLRTSLEYGAFPEHADGESRYLMAGGIGDPVIFYALTNGPIWKRLALPGEDIGESL